MEEGGEKIRDVEGEENRVPTGQWEGRGMGEMA